MIFFSCVRFNFEANIYFFGRQVLILIIAFFDALKKSFLARIGLAGEAYIQADKWYAIR